MDSSNLTRFKKAKVLDFVQEPAGKLTSDVDSVQAAVHMVQKQMRQYDGSFVQFRCDEKGFLSICAFGLPGKSQEGGARRATEAALSLVAAMREINQVHNCVISAFGIS